jgi:hypothetical protein
MSTAGHAYRDTWYGGQRCWCCNRTDTDLRYARNTRARHCEQAQAGYFYCQATPDDPCGPGPYPHAGHKPGQCAGD